MASADPQKTQATSSRPTAKPESASTNEFICFDNQEVDHSISDRFEKIVRQYPDRLAVKMGDRSLTYDQLNRTANRIARSILEIRGRGSEPIALLFEHGIDVIAAIFGVLKAGKFYVALDPSFPRQRLNGILTDCESPLIVTNNRNRHLVETLTNNTHALLDVDIIEHCVAPQNLGIAVSSGDLANIRYTSGSTGEPKGVVQAHRQILHFGVLGARRRSITSDDRLSLTHSVSFASASTELFQSLLNGAALLAFDLKSEGVHRFADWLENQEITVCHASPQLFRQLAESISSDKQLGHIRLFYLSGAPITRFDFDLFRSKCSPLASLEIGMGSTEAGLICGAIVGHDFLFPSEGTPIGYPIAGKKVLLLDDNGQEVGPNEIGEIAVKGRGVNPGYWKKPELTSAKFLPDPDGGDERIFLTGDWARKRPDGFLVHLGRKDFQIKIRGYRVELAEIEKALLTHPQVSNAGVVAWDRKPGEKSLVAYVVPHRSQTPTINELYDFLKGKLPDYMIPSAFVFLDSLPLTNGKLDRTALPLPERRRPEMRGPFVPSQTNVEKQLIEIWQEVLGIDGIGIHDDFFELGGHSLLGARLITQMQQDFKLDFPLRDLFESPTVALLAERIVGRNRQGKSNHQRLVKLHGEPGDKPIFCFPYRGGFRNEYFNFTRISRCLDGRGYSFYGLLSRDVHGLGEPRRSVKEIAADCLQDIQGIQAHGPYCLIGECGGGILAYEAAQQLQVLGEKVALLVLFDTEAWSLRRSIWWRLTEQRRYRLRFNIKRQPLRLPWIWDYFRARIKLHLEELGHLRGRARLRYLLSKVIHASTAVPYSWKRRSSVHDRGTNRSQNGNEYLARANLEHAEKAYFLAAHRHRYRRYNGPIALLVNEEWHASDPTLGWDKFAAGGLDVYKIPGNHDTCIPANIPLVAQLLRDCLEKVDTQLKPSLYEQA
jgi:amino acid adenylation domain-containing protein